MRVPTGVMVDTAGTAATRRKLNAALTFNGMCNVEWSLMSEYLDNWMGEFVELFVPHVLHRLGHAR